MTHTQIPRRSNSSPLSHMKFFFSPFLFSFFLFLCAKHHGFNTIKQIDHHFNNCWRGLDKLWSIPHKHTPSPLRVIRFMWKPPKPHPYVEWIDPICIGTIWDVRTSKLRVFLDFPSGCGGSPKVAMFWFLSCNRFPIFVQKKERERERSNLPCYVLDPFLQLIFQFVPKTKSERERNLPCQSYLELCHVLECPRELSRWLVHELYVQWSGRTGS